MRIYVVFYLSSGNKIIFEVKDKVNVKDKVAIIPLNETVEFESMHIKLTKLTNALGYTMVYFESNFLLTHHYQFTAEIDGIEKKAGSQSEGGGEKYSGVSYFDPIDFEKQKVVLKIRKNNTGEEHRVLIVN